MDEILTLLRDFVKQSSEKRQNLEDKEKKIKQKQEALLDAETDLAMNDVYRNVEADIIMKGDPSSDDTKRRMEEIESRMDFKQTPDKIDSLRDELKNQKELYQQEYNTAIQNFENDRTMLMEMIKAGRLQLESQQLDAQIEEAKNEEEEARENLIKAINGSETKERKMELYAILQEKQNLTNQKESEKAKVIEELKGTKKGGLKADVQGVSVDDLKALENSVGELNFENVKDFMQNPIITKLQDTRSLDDTENQGRDNDSESFDNTDGQGEDTGLKSREDNGETIIIPKPIDSNNASSLKNKTAPGTDLDNQQVKPVQKDSGNSSLSKTQVLDNSQDNQNESGKVNVIHPEILGIVVGKGITIYLENAKKERVEIDLKEAKEYSKLDKDEKYGILTKYIASENLIGYSVDEALEKMDPNVIIAFAKTQNYGMDKKEIGKQMQTYLNAACGDKQAQEEMKRIITYDETEITLKKSPKGIISRIINYKYFREVKKYIGKSKDFARVVANQKKRGIRNFFSKRNIPLLDKGKEKATGIAEKLKEKVENTVDEGKDSLEDTAAKGNIFRTALQEGVKQGTQTFKTSYQEGTKKYESSMFQKIPKGPDLRTPKEKAEDENIKNGNGEER